MTSLTNQIDDLTWGIEDSEYLSISLQNLQLLKFFYEQGIDFKKNKNLLPVTPEAIMGYNEKTFDLFLFGLHQLIINKEQKNCRITNFHSFDSDGYLFSDTELISYITNCKQHDLHFVVIEDLYTTTKDKQLLLELEQYQIYHIGKSLVITYEYEGYLFELLKSIKDNIL